MADLATLTRTVHEAVKTGRWTSERKHAVLTLIDAGHLTAGEAGRRYRISEEELASWRERRDRFGIAGLKQTRLQSVGPHRRRGSPHRATAPSPLRTVEPSPFNLVDAVAILLCAIIAGVALIALCGGWPAR